MKPTDLPRNYTILAAFSTVAGLVGLFLPADFSMAWVFGLIYGLSNVWMTGTAFFRLEHPIWRLVLGLPVFLAILSAVSGIAYQFHNINRPILTTIAVGLPWLLLWLNVRFPPDIGDRLMAKVRLHRKNEPMTLIGGLVVLTASLTLIGIGFSILGNSSTEISLRTPWDTVPSVFFTIFFLAALASFGLAFTGTIGRLAVLPLAGLALLAVSVAILSYRVGFGFDPFIHQATERIIYATGNVTPKPFYYSGQYALVVAIAKLTKLGLVSVDRWILPLSLAGLLPFAAFSLRRSFQGSWSVAATAAGGLLLIPLGAFIVTTPQGLANLFALFTLFAVLPVSLDRSMNNPLGRCLPGIFAVSAAITHPLTGLPLLAFTAVWMLLVNTDSGKEVSWKNRTAAFAVALLGSAVLPIALLTSAALSGTDVSWNGRISVPQPPSLRKSGPPSKQRTASSLVPWILPISGSISSPSPSGCSAWADSCSSAENADRWPWPMPSVS